MSDPYVFQPGEAELRWLGDTSTFFLATGETTGGGFCLVDELAHRDEAVPLHRHPDDVESFYVIEGELTLFLEDRPGVSAPAGSFAHVPAGTVHGFRVASETARYLLLTTAHHGEFYRAISFPAQAGGERPLESIDAEQIGRAARDYGIEFIGPLPD